MENFVFRETYKNYIAKEITYYYINTELLLGFLFFGSPKEAKAKYKEYKESDYRSTNASIKINIFIQRLGLFNFIYAEAVKLASKFNKQNYNRQIIQYLIRQALLHMHCVPVSPKFISAIAYDSQQLNTAVFTFIDNIGIDFIPRLEKVDRTAWDDIMNAGTAGQLTALILSHGRFKDYIDICFNNAIQIDTNDFLDAKRKFAKTIQFESINREHATKIGELNTVITQKQAELSHIRSNYDDVVINNNPVFANYNSIDTNNSKININNGVVIPTDNTKFHLYTKMIKNTRFEKSKIRLNSQFIVTSLLNIYNTVTDHINASIAEKHPLVLNSIQCHTFEDRLLLTSIPFGGGITTVDKNRAKRTLILDITHPILKNGFIHLDFYSALDKISYNETYQNNLFLGWDKDLTAVSFSIICAISYNFPNQ